MRVIDRNKKLFLEKCLEKAWPYLSDLITDLQESGT